MYDCAMRLCNKPAREYYIGFFEPDIELCLEHSVLAFPKKHRSEKHGTVSNWIANISRYVSRNRGRRLSDSLSLC